MLAVTKINFDQSPRLRQVDTPLSSHSHEGASLSRPQLTCASLTIFFSYLHREDMHAHEVK